MKALLIAGALTLAAGAAGAQGWGLMGPTVECRGLESLVVFGLIDGGEGGDTSEISDVIAYGDSALCLEWLDSYGYPGLYNPDCAQAFDILSTNGLPEWLAGAETDFVRDLLAPFAPDSCANLLFDLTAGQ
jgi:hypothetical protein